MSIDCDGDVLNRSNLLEGVTDEEHTDRAQTGAYESGRVTPKAKPKAKKKKAKKPKENEFMKKMRL